MPKPYPKEFRQNVIEVARAREAGTTLKEIAKDFGILRVVSDELDRHRGPSGREQARRGRERVW